MNDSTQQTQEALTPEQELQIAQERLEEAKKRAAEAAAAKRQALEDQIAAMKRDQQRKEMAAREAHEKKIEDMRKRKEAEENARMQAKRDREALERRLQAEADRLEQEQKEQQRIAEQTRKLSQDAYDLEQQILAEQRDTIRALQMAQEIAAAPISTMPDVTADSDDQGRLRLFQRTAQEHSLADVPQTPVDQQSGSTVHTAYEIRGGRLNPEVFNARFGVDRILNFFVSPNTANFVAQSYEWKLQGTYSGRDWQHNAECFLVDDNGTYFLTLKRNPSVRIQVVPVATCEGAVFEELPKPKLVTYWTSSYNPTDQGEEQQ